MLWRGSVARFNLSMIYIYIYINIVLLAWALACEAFRINQLKTTIRGNLW